MQAFIFTQAFEKKKAPQEHLDEIFLIPYRIVAFLAKKKRIVTLVQVSKTIEYL